MLFLGTYCPVRFRKTTSLFLSNFLAPSYEALSPTPFLQGNYFSRLPPESFCLTNPQLRGLHSAKPLTSQTRATPSRFCWWFFSPKTLLSRGSSHPVPVQYLPSQTSGGGQGAPVPPQAVQGLQRSDQPKPRQSSHSAALADGRFSQENPQPPPCLFPRRPHWGSLPPSASLLPRTRATPSHRPRPPRLPQLSPLGPLPDFPGSPTSSAHLKVSGVFPSHRVPRARS